MLRFTILGFPVTIHWLFWLVSAFMGGALSAKGPAEFRNVLIWMFVVFISILWHELGHAFAFRRYGRQATITLHGMGGYAQASGGLTRKQDIIVSLAGPVFGFVLGLVMWLLVRQLPASVLDKDAVNLFFVYMLFVNIIWSAVNLLPVLPLDGGRVCAALVAGKSAGLAPKIGIVTGIAMVLVAFRFQQTYVAILFGFLAYQNWQMLQNVHGRPSGGSPFGGGGGPFGGPR